MLTLALSLVACTGGTLPSPGGGTTEGLDSELVYDLDHLLRVEIELPEQDWDALREQTRTLADTIMKEDCQAEPFESPFTWFEASATLDGEHLPRVDVRKKGFLGSLSADKPALKLDLGEYDEEATFHGVRRLTLNNSQSDPSFVTQCLTYATFADVGLPAPRCSLAQVTVNGEDLGLFVNLEPIKEPLLERLFGSSEGNLYEGTLADFRDGWTGTLEMKNNEDTNDRSDIDALVAAADADDDVLLEELDAVIDLDAFFDFWAAEVLVQHIDGYASNTNNYYLYADPSDGRFHFIPWGADETFNGGGWDEEEEESTGPDSVYASSILSWRLYNHPEGQARYLGHLQGLVDEIWSEELAGERIDRMWALIEPELAGEMLEFVQAELELVRRVVESRRADIDEELADGPVSWPWGLRDSYCFEPVGSLDAVFETTWGTLDTEDWLNTGSSTTEISLEDETWPVLEGGALAGTWEEDTVLYLTSRLSPFELVIVYLALEEDRVAPGDVELDLDQAFGALLYMDSRTMDDFGLLSYAIGTLRFDEASTVDGATVEGSVEGELIFF